MKRLIVSALGCASLLVAQEEQSPLLQSEDRGSSWLDSWSDNLRFKFDIAARGFYNNRRNDELSTGYFLGIDLHKVISGPNGDLGTLLLQPFLTRLDVPAAPFFFEDNHDWELVWRISSFNYTALADGRFNIKVGHFEIPFGLEHYVNTNGTLLDYAHGRNIGVKADWGVTLNGDLDDFEYEFALSRGTGNEWSQRGEPWLASGRVGTNRAEDFSCGVSFFHGEVQKTMLPGNVQERTRLGIDAQLRVGEVALLGELSAGDDGGMDVVNGIFEVDWFSPDETVQIYNQVFVFNTDMAAGWQDAVANALGLRWQVTGDTTFSAQWRQDVSVFGNGKRAGTYTMQIRHRF